MENIIIKEFEIEVLNGDRASIKTQYSRFEIWIGNELLQEFTGYDKLWGSYKSLLELKSEVFSFAKKLGKYEHLVYVMGVAPWILKELK